MSGGARSGDVAVVIPARNEADRIQATVTSAAGIAGVALVIVVDDGSTDGTAAVAQRAGAMVTRHARNRGKGAAISSSPPRSRARRRQESSTFMPVESQNSTPDMSITTRGGMPSASSPASSLCSRGAV